MSADPTTPDNQSGELLYLLGGRLQLHTVEPLVIVDGFEVAFGRKPTEILQVLAQPLGDYFDKSTLYERVWRQPYNLDTAASATVNKAIRRTRIRLSEEFGSGSGKQILTSTAITGRNIIRYALYEPPHLLPK